MEKGNVALPYNTDSLKKDLTKHYVLEKNDFVKAISKMSLSYAKLFEICVSMIDPKNPPENNEILIPKTYIYDLFEWKNSGRSREIHKRMKRFHQEAVFEFKTINSKTNRAEYVVVSSISKSSFLVDEEHVYIKFNEDIMPYITDMNSGKYTRFPLKNIINLTSKYAIVLYKNLVMLFNQYEAYATTGKRTYEQLESYKCPEYSVEELREMTDTIDQYKRSYDFELNIIKDVVKDINENTDLSVSYKKIKKGRTIVGYKFSVERKLLKIAPEPTPDVRNLMTSDEREAYNYKMYAEAMQSQYTTILRKFGFIKDKDMSNLAQMIAYREELYPKYDVILENWGEDELERHIEYVLKTVIQRYGSVEEIFDPLMYLLKPAQQRVAQLKIKNIDR